MSWLIARIKEPSTMAGIAVVAGAVQHGAQTGRWGAALAASLPALLAVVMPENKGS